MIQEHETGWWIGKNNGKQGFFPSNYVEKIETEIKPRTVKVRALYEYEAANVDEISINEGNEFELAEVEGEFGFSI